MGNAKTNEKIEPKCLDRSEYPFKSNFFELPIGRMHYVDEGQATRLSRFTAIRAGALNSGILLRKCRRQTVKRKNQQN
ncbi:MAG: alpha/beta fold hydrolase [Ignavibacteria bacterium]|nr:alpha/beta fold hydrolase [Ignavibacteria bacterium]